MNTYIKKMQEELNQALKEFNTIQSDCENFNDVNHVCNRAIERLEIFMTTTVNN